MGSGELDWNEAGGEKKVELENRYRDRLMDLFLEMVRESGYQLGGVQIMMDSVEVEDGGVSVRSEVGFYWMDEEKIVN